MAYKKMGLKETKIVRELRLIAIAFNQNTMQRESTYQGIDALDTFKFIGQQQRRGNFCLVFNYIEDSELANMTSRDFNDYKKFMEAD